MHSLVSGAPQVSSMGHEGAKLLTQPFPCSLEPRQAPPNLQVIRVNTEMVPGVEWREEEAVLPQPHGTHRDEPGPWPCATQKGGTGPHTYGQAYLNV